MAFRRWKTICMSKCSDTDGTTSFFRVHKGKHERIYTSKEAAFLVCGCIGSGDDTRNPIQCNICSILVILNLESHSTNRISSSTTESWRGKHIGDNNIFRLFIGYLCLYKSRRRASSDTRPCHIIHGIFLI